MRSFFFSDCTTPAPNRIIELPWPYFPFIEKVRCALDATTAAGTAGCAVRIHSPPPGGGTFSFYYYFYFFFFCHLLTPRTNVIIHSPPQMSPRPLLINLHDRASNIVTTVPNFITVFTIGIILLRMTRETVWSLAHESQR